MSISERMEGIYDKISNAFPFDENSNFYKIVEETIANPTDNISNIAEDMSEVIFPNIVNNGLVYNQLFKGDVYGQCQVVYNGDVLEVISNDRWFYISTSDTYNLGSICINGHKYYCHCLHKTDVYAQGNKIRMFACKSSYVQGFNYAMEVKEYWQPFDFIGILYDFSGGARIGVQGYPYSTLTSKLFLKDIMIIDLTVMFGAGNEPTLEECKKIFTKNIGFCLYGDITPWSLVPHDEWLRTWGKTLNINNQYCLDVGKANGITTEGISHLIWSKFENAGGWESTETSGRHDYKIITKNPSPTYFNELYYVEIKDSTETTINSTGAIFNNGTRGLNHQFEVHIGILKQHNGAIAPSILANKYMSIVDAILKGNLFPNAQYYLTIHIFDDTTYQEIYNS